MKSVKGLMKELVPLAKEILVEAGRCDGTVMILAEGNLHVLDDTLRSRRDVDAMRRTTRAIIAKSRPQLAITVSETWLVKSETDNLTMPVSEHPARKEALVIVGRDPHDHLMCLIPFTRWDGRIIFDQEIWQEPEISWFNGCKFYEAPGASVARSQGQA
jgi:hypothetical protein